MSSKKFVAGFIIFAVVVIAFAGASAWWLRSRQNNQSAQQDGLLSRVPTSALFEKEQVNPDRLPDGFPASLPVEAKAKITENFVSTTPQGIRQATRAFETARTLDENAKIYNDYLNKEGYAPQMTVNTPTNKAIYGKKGSNIFTISMSENSVTKTRVVSISLSAPVQK